MSEMSSGANHGPGRYEIQLKGHLHPRWTSWFDDMTVTNHDDGTTVICGSVTDQAALHGLLNKVRDIGLPLISVVRVPANETPAPPADPAPHTTSP